MSNYGLTLPRRNEHPVTLVYGESDQLTGIRYFEHWELPFLIHVPSIQQTLYQEVWEKRGWKVERA